MFRDSAIHYSEDLMFMPIRCFDFYVGAFISYLTSDLSKGDADGANTFIGLIESRLLDLRGTSSETNRLIEQALEFVSVRQEYFDAEPELYDCFQEKTTSLLAKIRASSWYGTQQSEGSQSL